jgi:hypothetical protein
VAPSGVARLARVPVPVRKVAVKNAVPMQAGNRRTIWATRLVANAGDVAKDRGKDKDRDRPEARGNKDREETKVSRARAVDEERGRVFCQSMVQRLATR